VEGDRDTKRDSRPNVGDPNVVFGLRLRYLREQSKRDVPELAADARIKPERIRRMEAGVRAPSLAEIVALKLALGLPNLAELLDCADASATLDVNTAAVMRTLLAAPRGELRHHELQRRTGLQPDELEAAVRRLQFGRFLDDPGDLPGADARPGRPAEERAMQRYRLSGFGASVAYGIVSGSLHVESDSTATR